MGDWQIRGSAQFSMVGQDTLVRPEAVYPSLTANTKGSWVELTDSSPIDASAFSVMIAYAFEGSDYLVDIGIGPAGSEQTVVSNLLVTVGTIGGNCPGIVQRIPTAIKAGTRIAARAQATGTSASRLVRCAVLLEDGGDQDGGRLITIGESTADSGGMQIDPGAVDNTKGAWVQLTASLANEIDRAFFAFGNVANTARTDCNWLVDIGIGGAGTEQVILPNIAVSANLTSDGVYPNLTAFYDDFNIPAGTRVAVRAACTIVDATDRLFDVVMYGIA